MAHVAPAQMPSTSSSLPDFGEDIEIDIGEATEELQDDGSMIIDFNPEGPAPAPIEFGGDLSELLTSTELMTLAGEIITLVEDDDRGRAKWKETYTKGLKLLGLNYEERTDPWQGACGAFHPLLLESVIRFNAQAMSDLFPGTGPVKIKIAGKSDEKVERQAKRVRRDLNYLSTEVVVGFREETDMMLMNLPLAGTTFRTWAYDAIHKRPEATYLLPEDVIIPYAAAALHSAERYTVVLHKTKNWIKSKQQQGFYRDVEVGAGTVTRTSLTEVKDEIRGQTAGAAMSHDWVHDIYECHINYYLEADPLNPQKRLLPYVISVDKQSHKVLSIRREWRETDDTQERVENVVQHKYMPGFGPYGIGLINILGGLTESATSLLRQLVDAGTLSNLPAGYKAKGMRIKNDSDPIGPGEWRDVDVGGGTLRENFFPLPYKEPSTVLAALLGQIVDEGRRIGSVADMKITDMTGQNMPVGTTLAIIERSMKVMNAVQQRLYESFGRELKVLDDIVRSYMKDQPYPFPLDDSEQGATREADYTNSMGVIPVADPNASTMAQKIMALQAVLQLSAAAPSIYDLPELHRDMVGVLGFEEQAERYIPREDQVEPRDPVSENMDLLNSRPVRAGIGQNHDAHIKVHMNAVNDPKMQAALKDNPAAGGIIAAASAHLLEHIAFQYRQQLEEQLGVQLPPPGEPLPEDVEYELAGLVVSAADKLLGKHEAEQKAIEVLAAMEDPVIQNEQRALDIKDKAEDNKLEIARMKDKSQGSDRKMDLLLTLLKEMSETERSTLAVEVQKGVAATDAQLRTAELASSMQGTTIGQIVSLLGLRTKLDIEKTKAKAKGQTE